MKEQIIDLAIRQLRLGGYEKLNFAAIADELGTTRANLHHHFKNKEGLGRAAIEHYVRNEERDIDVIFTKHDGNLPALLDALERHFIVMVRGDRELTACVGSQILRDSVAPESLRALVLARFRDEANDVKEHVAKHFDSLGVYDTSRVTALTFKIVAAMHGIEMMRLIEPDQNTLISGIRGSLTSLL